MRLSLRVDPVEVVQVNEWVSVLLFREAIELAAVGIVLGMGLTAVVSAIAAVVSLGVRILHKCI